MRHEGENDRRNSQRSNRTSDSTAGCRTSPRRRLPDSATATSESTQHVTPSETIQARRHFLQLRRECSGPYSRPAHVTLPPTLRLAFWRAFEHDAFAVAKASAFSSILTFFPASCWSRLRPGHVAARARPYLREISYALGRILPAGSSHCHRVSHRERPSVPSACWSPPPLLTLWTASGVMISWMEGFRRCLRAAEDLGTGERAPDRFSRWSFLPGIPHDLRHDPGGLRQSDLKPASCFTSATSSASTSVCCGRRSAG